MAQSIPKIIDLPKWQIAIKNALSSLPDRQALSFTLGSPITLDSISSGQVPPSRRSASIELPGAKKEVSVSKDVFIKCRAHSNLDGGEVSKSDPEGIVYLNRYKIGSVVVRRDGVVIVGTDDRNLHMLTSDTDEFFKALGVESPVEDNQINKLLNVADAKPKTLMIVPAEVDTSLKTKARERVPGLFARTSAGAADTTDDDNNTITGLRILVDDAALRIGEASEELFINGAWVKRGT